MRLRTNRRDVFYILPVTYPYGPLSWSGPIATRISGEPPRAGGVIRKGMRISMPTSHDIRHGPRRRAAVRIALGLLAGTIVVLLVPAAGPALAGEEESWRARFDRVYNLGQEEVLKRIAPPFIDERMDFYQNIEPTQAAAIPAGPATFYFRWDGRLRTWGMSFGGERTVADVINMALGLRRDEFEGPERLLGMKLPGDWIVRSSVPREDALQALADILLHDEGRRIAFEKHRVEREVIVARGRFRFKPADGTYDRTSIHVYEGGPDRGEGGGGASGTIGEFLKDLGNVALPLPVIDETRHDADARVEWRWNRSGYLRGTSEEADRTARIDRVLANLSAQTGLRFDRERRPMEIWFLVERKGARRRI
jgi:hypothetical protein